MSQVADWVAFQNIIVLIESVHETAGHTFAKKSYFLIPFPIDPIPPTNPALQGKTRRRPLHPAKGSKVAKCQDRWDKTCSLENRGRFRRWMHKCLHFRVKAFPRSNNRWQAHLHNSGIIHNSHESQNS